VTWLDRNARLAFGDMPASRKRDFLSKSYRGRQFFAHRVVHLPKCGPDGYKLARRMCSELDPNALSEMILYAAPELADAFPDELWFDDDLIWHQQQFGRTGQVATVNLRRHGADLYSMAHVSDLVQRISRWPAYKSRVEDRFRHWPKILLNAILDHALRNGFNRLFVPRSRLAMKNTDPARTVGPELFERVYDRAVRRFSPTQTRDWWIVDIAKNRDLIIPLEPGSEPIGTEKTICICHDIERGLGHLDCDPDFARWADDHAPDHLQRMVEIERDRGVSATYNVVGTLLDQVRPLIEGAGHEVAFHSFNHVISQEQLRRCRSLDYRIKGYRPPQSRVTRELSDSALCHENFEWFASSRHSLGFSEPKMKNRIAKIPILFDDFAMHDKHQPFEEWRNNALGIIRSSSFVAFSLHDCYAGFWLDYYPEFLDEISQLASFSTLNQVAAELTFRESLEWQQPKHPS